MRRFSERDAGHNSLGGTGVGFALRHGVKILLGVSKLQFTRYFCRSNYKSAPLRWTMYCKTGTSGFGPSYYVTFLVGFVTMRGPTYSHPPMPLIPMAAAVMMPLQPAGFVSRYHPGEQRMQVKLQSPFVRKRPACREARPPPESTLMAASAHRWAGPSAHCRSCGLRCPASAIA